MYRRFAKYGAFDPQTYAMHFHGNILAYTRETTPTPYSAVTVLDVVTEVPDEVAQGQWLQQVAQAGLQVSLESARILAETGRRAVRTVQELQNGTEFRIARTRCEADE
jgi:hypothetical protein